MTNRKQIAAANWKMNLSFKEAETLLNNLVTAEVHMSDNKQAIFAVPFPYLDMAKSKLENLKNYFVAAQDCSAQVSGAYTGEVSTGMLSSMSISHVLIGHSERRSYHQENSSLLAQKIDRALEQGLHPIFCCGEALEIREAGGEQDFVAQQIAEGLFHLPAEKMKGFIIAYEPIWAIGTGKTASSEQAQEMHQHIRSVLQQQYGKEVAQSVSILYGGSVKDSNAAEIFGKPDVDGGLVGGASLDAHAFSVIMKALK